MKQPCRQSSSSAKSALVVGASAATSTALGDLFARIGWRVAEVPDNEAALRSVEACAFDLIVTGERSSGAEDVDLLRQIRAIRPHVRIIILTAESTPAEVIASMRERAFSYFSHPISLDALCDMVRIAAEGPTWDDGIEVLSATPSWIRLLARCERKTADRLLQFFHELTFLPHEEKEAVAYAFREMLLNAMGHGGGFDPQQYVEIAYIRARHMVACRVKDPGNGFSLEELYHAAVANPPEHPTRHVVYREAAGLPPGGYGILLAKHMVDELIYGERGNDVLLVKYLLPETAGNAKPVTAA
jgi:DNA-binding NarL/FixJ family response regulator